MTNAKSRMTWSMEFSMKKPHPMQHYYEPNDAYFRKHLQKLVKAHGGNVVVMVGGSLIGVSHEAELKN